MLATDLATRAAIRATTQLGLGHPTFHASSAAVTFTTPQAFLRVVPDGQDSPGTIAVAHYVTTHLDGAKPLSDALPITVDSTRVWVETYQRLTPTTAELGTWQIVGERLAALHALEPDPTLRPARRLTASRARLAQASQSLSDELLPHFDQATQTLISTPGPQVLCHADAHRGNLLYLSTGPVWVDFEYAGLAPAAYDLAFTLGDIVRYAPGNPNSNSADFIAGYCHAGGQPDLAAVLALSRIRDICGVADCIPLAALDPLTWNPQLELCHATYQEPFRHTQWYTSGPV
jgi:aminoglycoside phosphotransferase (APT) family kinase protein